MKHTNKLWVFLVALIALAALCAFAANAETVTGTCGAQGDNLTWSYDTETKTLTISGTGAMVEEEYPWEDYKEQIQSVVIEEGVTSIGYQAFWDCTALESVELPDGLESIGVSAFGNCPVLYSITIPASVTNAIAAFVGEGTTGYLKNVTLTEGLKTISSVMFFNTDLTEVTIPNSVEEIGAMSFACPYLVNVQIGTGLKEIGYAAMNGALWNAMLGENAYHGPHIVRTCMTQAEWNANVTVRLQMTQEEAAIIGGDDPSAMPEADWILPSTEIIYDSHVPNAANTFCTLCGKSLNASDPEPPIEDPHPGQEHQVSSVIWAWTADGTGATAIGVCTLCSQQVLAAADVQVQTNSDGSKTCNATVVIGDRIFRDTRVISVDPNPPITPKPQTGFRCGMCSVYEEYKGKGFIGLIVSLVHTFVHLAARISAR